MCKCSAAVFRNILALPKHTIAALRDRAGCNARRPSATAFRQSAVARLR
jgi:hypothetical protein